MVKGFNELTGIEKERELKKEEDQVLEKLIKITKEILKQPHSDLVYPYLELQTRSFSFDLGNVKNLVHSFSNNGYDISERIMAGFVMSEILRLYKDRNENKENIQFEIDGNGTKFDYLFNSANCIDELIIRNFVGENICCNLSINKGRNKTVALLNLKGEQLAEGVGYNKGRIQNLVLIGNESDSLLGLSEGEIDLLIAINNKANNFCPIDEDYETCKINNMIIIDNEIGYIHSMIDNAKFGRVIIRDNSIDTGGYCPHVKSLIEKGYKNINKERADYIANLARAINPNDTEQMLSKVYKIRDELNKRK